ncbi:MAG TPA: Rieske 2Fe-2S domain-containing protein [Gemmatimonadales bacterium]|nr:Rieske 2Fe-2S domain-containing protein [Gemmatimonadales bacterium]
MFRSPDPCPHDCAAGSDRRSFLREAAGAALAALGALALDPREAVALPIALGRALRREGGAVTYAPPSADGVTIDKDNEVILVRWKGMIYAFALSCPHQNTALRWRDGDSQFQCPKHKSRYQPDGTFLEGKATRNMDRHPIRRVKKQLVVDTAVLLRNDKQAALWAAAKVVV